MGISDPAYRTLHASFSQTLSVLNQDALGVVFQEVVHLV